MPTSSSPVALFIWADNTTGQSQYRIWNGAALTGNTLLAGIPTAGNTGEWARLVAQPGSNNLIYGVQDTGADLRSVFWNGAAWGSNTLHDGAVEDILDRNFDIVFETHPANTAVAWIMWGNGATVSTQRWSGAWAAASVLGGPSDDTALVQLLAHPYSGAVFAGIYEDSTSAADDIRATTLTGGVGAWPALPAVPGGSIWAGPTVANPVNERVNIGVERIDPVINGLEIYP